MSCSFFGHYSTFEMSQTLGKCYQSLLLAEKLLERVTPSLETEIVAINLRDSIRFLDQLSGQIEYSSVAKSGHNLSSIE
jgi:hypothetical protein